MTTDRHLALMTLMNEITAPAKTYDHCVRRAAAALSDSPEYNAAVERGNAALEDIEDAVRRWVAKHPEQTASPLPDNFTEARAAFFQIGHTPSLQGLRTELHIEGRPPLIGQYAGAEMGRLPNHDDVLSIRPQLLFRYADEDDEQSPTTA
jgi:hypothetical protein